MNVDLSHTSLLNHTYSWDPNPANESMVESLDPWQRHTVCSRLACEVPATGMQASVNLARLPLAI